MSDLFRASTFEDIILAFNDAAPNIIAELGGRGSITAKKFQGTALLNDVGITTTLKLTATLDPDLAMIVLERCGLYVSTVLHHGFSSADVILRDDEWPNLAMHLRLLGVLDGSYDFDD